MDKQYRYYCCLCTQAQASNLAGLLLLENKIITPNLGHWLRQSRGRGKHSVRITVLSFRLFPDGRAPVKTITTPELDMMGK